MAEIGKSANLKFTLNGKNTFPPKDWEAISIQATFENGNVQPNITTEQFTFILDAYNEIITHIQAGSGSGVGIFEGIPFDITTFSTLGQFEAFKGFIDTTDELNINPEFGEIEAKIKKLDGLNSLTDRLAANTFLTLLEEGVITDADYTDLDYIVQKVDITQDLLLTSIMLYSLTKALIDVTRAVAKLVADILALGGGVFSAGAGALLTILGAAVNLAYAAALVTQIVTLVRQFINLLVPPIRTHKVLNLKTGLEKVFNYLGYGFNTTISEYDNLYYLPSNTNYDERNPFTGFLDKAQTVEKGVPNATDYGYSLLEFVNLCSDLYNGRFAVFKGDVQLHTELAPYWQKQATWDFPDILQPPYQYNTEGLFSNVFITFNRDVQDKWTTENFTGTNYQIITDAIRVNDQKKKVIQNLDEVRLPVALGTRKEDLNAVERALAAIAGTIDDVTNAISNVIPGLNVRTNFKQGIVSRIGVLKVTENNHSVPKVLWLEGGKLPPDYRDKFSAKTLWEGGHNEKSFIQNNFRRQRRVYADVEIPFGFSDFLKVIDNAYFPNFQGRQGKILSLNWQISQDKARVSFYVEDIYTKNLVETEIEP